MPGSIQTLKRMQERRTHRTFGSRGDFISDLTSAPGHTHRRRLRCDWGKRGRNSKQTLGETNKF